MEHSSKEERARRIARHLMDRLIQDLTKKLLPILESDSRIKVEITGNSERSMDKPLTLSVTEIIN